VIDFEALKENIRTIINPLIKDFDSIALFDFPNYSNVGDSAIWLGTMDYLKENACSSRIIWVSDKKSINERNLPVFDNSTVLIICGGGNFGDLWEDHQENRKKIISNYPDNRIIQFPQSIHFQRKSNLESTKNVITKHKDLHLLVRDLESFEVAKSFVGTKVYLCPDMAFYINKLPRLGEAKHDIIALMRTDKESAISEDYRKYQIPSFDWLSEPRTVAVRFDSFMRSYPSIMRRFPSINNVLQSFVFKRLAEERFKRGCQLLVQGKVVITDRLHAHIMCMLLGIPSIVLDNSYNKIKNIMSLWESSSEKTYQTDSFDEAVELASKYLEK